MRVPDVDEESMKRGSSHQDAKTGSRACSVQGGCHHGMSRQLYLPKLARLSILHVHTDVGAAFYCQGPISCILSYLLTCPIGSQQDAHT